MIHMLKSWPEHWSRINDGTKKFEVRKADRDFRPGDTVFLREWDPSTKEYTTRVMSVTIGYVLQAKNTFGGIKDGYVVFSVNNRKR